MDSFVPTVQYSASIFGHLFGSFFWHPPPSPTTELVGALWFSHLLHFDHWFFCLFLTVIYVLSSLYYSSLHGCLNMCYGTNGFLPLVTSAASLWRNICLTGIWWHSFYRGKSRDIKSWRKSKLIKVTQPLSGTAKINLPHLSFNIKAFQRLSESPFADEVAEIYFVR